MPTRKVTVCIYQYPEDANRTMSLRRFMELSQEILWNERFLSSADLRNIMALYRRQVTDYAALVDTPHVYGIVVRDSDSRLISTFRI